MVILAYNEFWGSQHCAMWCKQITRHRAGPVEPAQVAALETLAGHFSDASGLALQPCAAAAAPVRLLRGQQPASATAAR